MKPHVTLKSHGTTQNIPYNIKISTKNNFIDQKRELIEVKPGYHLTIRVIPKVVDASEAFETFEYQTRNCKLAHENHERPLHTTLTLSSKLCRNIVLCV